MKQSLEETLLSSSYIFDQQLQSVMERKQVTV